MPFGVHTVVDLTGILDSLLSEHKASSGVLGTLRGGGGGHAVMNPVSQCCLNIVDSSVKSLFKNISV